MDTELPKRKQNRLPQYDYSTTNAYFVTVCTQNRRNLFWKSVGAIIDRPQSVRLSALGEIVNQAIRNIPSIYPAVSVDKYVIMPNHVHLLLQICSDFDGRSMIAPTISTVVRQMKGTVTRQAGFPVWQKGFHDHVVRGSVDYQEIWAYIENNPVKWVEDKLNTCIQREAEEIVPPCRVGRTIWDSIKSRCCRRDGGKRRSFAPHLNGLESYI